MNRQQVFDRVAAHLLRQAEKSRYGSSCRYRGPQNLQCAVGCLIDDTHYTQELEGKGAGNPYVVEAVALSTGFAADEHEDGIRLLEELQWIHDSVLNMPDTWPDRLRKIAADFGLDYREDLYGAA